jgi:hypothetical protein
MDPGPMLDYLRASGNLSERRAWLFVFASCRRFYRLLPDHRSREAVEVAERYLEGEFSQETLFQARLLSHAAYMEGRALEATTAGHSPAGEWAHRNAADLPFAAYITTCCDSPGNVEYNVRSVIVDNFPLVRAFQPCLFRDVFGNPFRPVAGNPAWLTPTVKGLSTAAYEERSLPSGEVEPALLAVLADALEEAGCTNIDMLSHLRGPGPHVRGCWVLDLLLRKN